MRRKQDHTRERTLRRNQTEAERSLWQHLRNRRLLNCKFRRQHRIGPYYVDFYCAAAMLIVEIDGSQHLEQSEYDQRRTRFLEAMGYRVQRFWNDEVLMNLDLVLDAIAVSLDTPLTLRAPSPRKRGEGSRARLNVTRNHCTRRYRAA